MNLKTLQNDIYFMEKAISEAKIAYGMDEVPVGAIIVNNNDHNFFELSHNLRETNNDVLAHAEIIAIQKITKRIKDWRLNDFTLYVTLEPCIMCMSILVQSRISRLVFGAYDNKGGSLSLGYHLGYDKRLNHRFPIVGGVKQNECSTVLKSFFKSKRK